MIELMTDDLFLFENLTSDNVIRYAMKNYDNPFCHNLKEFEDDLNHSKYIKKLLSRYLKTGCLRERHILNHLITMSNIFGNLATARILFLKLDEKMYSPLKTFLLFLNIMPNVVYGIDGKNIISSDIMVDMKIVNVLRKI